MQCTLLMISEVALYIYASCELRYFHDRFCFSSVTSRYRHPNRFHLIKIHVFNYSRWSRDYSRPDIKVLVMLEVFKVKVAFGMDHTRLHPLQIGGG